MRENVIDFLHIFTQISCNLSILSVENISVLLNSSARFFIDRQGLLLIERKGMHYIEVYKYLEFVRLKARVAANFN